MIDNITVNLYDEPLPPVEEVKFYMDMTVKKVAKKLSNPDLYVNDGIKCFNTMASMFPSIAVDIERRMNNEKLQGKHYTS